MVSEHHALDALRSHAEPPTLLTMDTVLCDADTGVDVDTPLSRSRKKEEGINLFSSSPYDWLDEHFTVDATDVLLGSFTCALKRGILIQGKLFVVAGEHGGPRVLFHSSLFRRVTTLELNLADVFSVEKKNSAGALSGLKIGHGDGEALVFCSLFYRENAYRCVYEAWRRAVGQTASPPPTLSPPPGIYPPPLSDSPRTQAQPPPASPTPGRIRRSNSWPPRVVPSACSQNTSLPCFPFPDVNDTSRRVLHHTFPGFDPELVYHALFDPNGALLEKHLSENCGADAIVIAPRTVSVASGKEKQAIATRSIKYSAPTSYKFPNMPKRCEVADTQEYTVCLDGVFSGSDQFSKTVDYGAGGDALSNESSKKTWTMRSSCAMRGAPFADCFVVRSLVRVTPCYSTGGTFVEVFGDVDWQKPVNGILKGLVQRGARDSLRKSYQKMLALCNAELLSASPAETELISKRGKRSFVKNRSRRACSVDSGEVSDFDVPREASFFREPGVAQTLVETVGTNQGEDEIERKQDERERPQTTQTLGDFADATWCVPSVILLVTALLGLYALSLYMFATEGVFFHTQHGGEATRRLDRVFPDEQRGITKRVLKQALLGAARDDAFLDAVVGFLNQRRIDE